MGKIVIGVDGYLVLWGTQQGEALGELSVSEVCIFGEKS